MRYLAPLLFLTALATPVVAAPISKVIAAAVADPARSAEVRAADETRKPAETLAFSGVKPGMIVANSIPAAAISRG